VSKQPQDLLYAVRERDLRPSSRQAVQRFQQILERRGVTATVRRSLGGDIDASCGQLRRNYLEDSNVMAKEEPLWTHGD